jgi:hypothetical protein
MLTNRPPLPVLKLMPRGHADIHRIAYSKVDPDITPRTLTAIATETTGSHTVGPVGEDHVHLKVFVALDRIFQLRPGFVGESRSNQNTLEDVDYRTAFEIFPPLLLLTQPKRIREVDRIPAGVPVEVEPTGDPNGILLGELPD